MGELLDQVQALHLSERHWRELEKKCEGSDEELQAFGRYHDFGTEFRKTVNALFATGATIKATLSSGSVHTVDGSLPGNYLCWENIQWMRYTDDKNYFRGFNWLAVTDVALKGAGDNG